MGMMTIYNYYNIGQRPDMTYQDWLTTKIQTAQKSGFFVPDDGNGEVIE